MYRRLLMPLLLLVWALAAMATGPEDALEVHVLRPLDGDTINVRLADPPPGVWVRERVRLLGIDAPELGEPFADEATRLLRELARLGETRLEIDQQLRDTHDRLLGHLWVQVDGTWLLVGEELLKAGLARTLFIPPNDRYWDRMRQAELRAQIAGAGLWGAYTEPLTLRALEKDPAGYVTEVLTVRFELARVEMSSAGTTLHAGGSRYGFHAIVEPTAWEDLASRVQGAIGSRFDVRGVLDWHRLEEGPLVRVEIGDQLDPVQEWPRGAFVHGPFVGAPETEAATVSWTASPPLPARVEYTAWDRYEETGAFHASVRHVPEGEQDGQTEHVRLEELDPATRYAYRVILEGDEGEQTSPVGAFRTAPSADEPVRFAIIADTQWQWDGVNRVQLVGEGLASDGDAFDFILHAGDLVESPTPRYWGHFFSSMSGVLLEAAFIPVLGNHERNSRTYYELFTLPPGGGRMDKRWWALEYGDVVVVGLDTNVSRPADYIAQVDFLRDKLSGDHQHRFVVLHHPVYSSDAIYGPGMEGLQNLFHPVFSELGADIVFSGHAHNYERIERDGVTYLTVGGGGATVRPLAEERVAGSVVADDGHLFYTKVTADAEGIEVEVVAVAEQIDNTVISAWGLLDSFTR